MREMKFRAWDTEAEMMRYAFWVGSVTGKAYSVKNASEVQEEAFDLMQFTGLKDKQGKDIYEGDIVVTGIGPDYVKSVVQIGESETYVDFSEYSISRPYYGVYLEGSIGLEKELLKSEMYVIGNIYETPELLPQNRV